MRNIVYISYNGMTDPLGESQVLGYLKLLSKKWRISLISFEKQSNLSDLQRIRNICEKNEIRFYPLTYHKDPPVLSTVSDISAGVKKVQSIIENPQETIIHARGYIAGMMALKLYQKCKIPYLFDMRGWMIDERIESGRFNNRYYKPVINVLRNKEREMINNAKQIISLTYCAKEKLVDLFKAESKKISIIPTCADKDIFRFDPEERVKARKELDLPDSAYVLIYSGSVGGYYEPDKMVLFFRCLLERIPDAYFLFLTKSSKDIVYNNISDDIKSRIRVTSTDYRFVYKYLSASDLGLVLYNNSFSSTGRSPTKLAEYWYCGLKVAAPANVGDLNRFFADKKGGAQFEQFNKESFMLAIDEIRSIQTSRSELAELADKYFSIESGVKSYNEVYEEMFAGGD